MTRPPATPGVRRLPRTSAVDTVRVLTTVLGPLVARGLVVRRPRVVAALDRLDADARAVRLLQRLRRRYGDGPLRLGVPGRRVVLVLAPDDVHRVLDGTPEPFSPATREKRAALDRFQPHGVLVSDPAARPVRRRFNEEVLATGRPVHPGAHAVLPGLHAELDALLAHVSGTGELTWDPFARAWWRVVRRVVLGAGAVDDEALTDDLRTLRAAANWAYLRPRDDALRERFLARLAEHLARAEPGSLAEHVARTSAPPGTDPVQQVPQWLFAFDAGAIATARALAVLATHPEALAEARAEARGSGGGSPHPEAPQPLPYLRACVLESLRLWPTTPAILRETTERTSWPGGPVPAGTAVIVHAPLFHRDDEHLPEAHRFAPGLWSRERTPADWPLVPFSAGPAACAGREVLLHVASTVLGRLVRDHEHTLRSPHRLDPGRPLPGSLDPFGLRFASRPLPAR